MQTARLVVLVPCALALGASQPIGFHVNVEIKASGAGTHRRDSLTRPLHHGLRQLQNSLTQSETVTIVHWTETGTAAVTADLTVRLGEYAPPTTAFDLNSSSEGFILGPCHQSTQQICIDAIGGAGAMYGLLELARRIHLVCDEQRGHSFEAPWATVLTGITEPLIQTPRFEYRALKFNLPWSAYRPGNATRLNFEVCRNLTYWTEFLDMMAYNRYNKLTVWAMHPWPYMVTPANFSLADSYNDTVFWGGDGSETAEFWHHFWNTLFSLAQDRAIKPYVVDWNVFVSEGYKSAYDTTAMTDHDGSGGSATVTPLARKYGREIITQTINNYPDLAGIGITLGDRMTNIREGSSNLKGQVDWIEDVVFGALRNANRTVELIYRAALDNQPTPTVRDSIEKFVMETAIKVWVQLKFNWSHGHSCVELVHAHGGGTGSQYWTPPSKYYKMVWMIRNEDFFFLRWGQAPFIRRHIAVNGESYVAGYIIGSEGHIPAFDYASKPPESTQNGSPSYDFQRQWLWYMQWGRLLYDPTTPDSVFSAEYNVQYSGLQADTGEFALQALQNASLMQLALASYVWSTWDFTLHSEGFLIPISNPDTDARGFISIETLLQIDTLDPTMQSIRSFVAMPNVSATGPYDVAKALNKAAAAATASLGRISRLDTSTLLDEMRDTQVWAHLATYFALKLQAGVSLSLYRKNGEASEQKSAVGNLTAAASSWAAVCNITSQYLGPYDGMIPLLDISPALFSWCAYTDMVERDIAIASKGYMHTGIE